MLGNCIGLYVNGSLQSSTRQRITLSFGSFFDGVLRLGRGQTEEELPSMLKRVGPL